MKYDFRRNIKDVHTIYQDFSEGKLYVDHSYQRRKVWNEEDKVRLIETMLLDLILPEVYFWSAERDPDTGIASTHIVDGQQRICTIVDFIDGYTDNKPFVLKEKYLLSKEIRESCGNKSFKELATEYKNKIWEYPISVVEIDPVCTKEHIQTMFYRLNLTNYSLNPQERRHSINSSFGDKAAALSTMDFWNKVKVFSAVDAKRMRDVEFCCSIFILGNEGVVDQSNDKKINEYYDDFAEGAELSFDKDNEIEEKIKSAMEIIEQLVDKQTLSFVSKKAQLYTLFCVVFSMINNNVSYTNEIFSRFKLFVETYNCFRNEWEISYSETSKSELLASIKRYKLASSEGINKYNNRMIRFKILYQFCVEGTETDVNNMNFIKGDFIKMAEEQDRNELDEEDFVE